MSCICCNQLREREIHYETSVCPLNEINLAKGKRIYLLWEMYEEY